MRTAFSEHETKIAELKQKEVSIETVQADIERQKARLKDKEAKIQKQLLLSEGTGQKLKIRKEELDKEWKRVDEIHLSVLENQNKLTDERNAFEAEKELMSTEKQEKVQLQFELKEQMRAMEVLTVEIEKKEKWLRTETDRLERLAAKLARKEKTLDQEKQRLTNWEAEVKTIQSEVVKQQTFITIERETLEKERNEL